MQPDDNTLMELYRKMLLVRTLEKRLEHLVTAARVPCSGHFGLGQEAVGVGVTGPLKTSDYLFGTHRGLAEYIGMRHEAERLRADRARFTGAS